MNRNLVIISGYFNPIHIGHINYIKAAKNLNSEKESYPNHLLVIVNNDSQVLQKKGKIIIPEKERLEIISSLRNVDTAILSMDSDRTVRKTLKNIALAVKIHNSIGLPLQNVPIDDIFFANGGDQSAETIPETETCRVQGIKMVFGIGGEKVDSSTRIIEEAEIG